MHRGFAYWLDVLLVFFIALVFALMVAQMLRRGRNPDGLSWALIALFSSLSVGYLIGGLAAIHAIPPLLPLWVGWVLRAAIIVSGLTVVGMLARDERQNWDKQ